LLYEVVLVQEYPSGDRDLIFEVWVEEGYFEDYLHSPEEVAIKQAITKFFMTDNFLSVGCSLSVISCNKIE